MQQRQQQPHSEPAEGLSTSPDTVRLLQHQQDDLQEHTDTRENGVDSNEPRGEDVQLKPHFSSKADPQGSTGVRPYRLAKQEGGALCTGCIP